MMFFRERRFVFFSLFLFLAVLLVAKFVFPLYLRAQSAASTSGSVSCHIDNTFEYVAPNCGIGTACPSIQGSYIPASGTAHIGDLTNKVEYINATTFKQWSGSGSFIYSINGNQIRLAQDNVWSGQYCSTGPKAMYRLISNDGSIGSPQRLQSMSCGQSVASDHKLQPYVYDPKVDTSTNPLSETLNTCTVPGYESSLHTEAQLIYGGKAKCNPSVNTSLGAIDVAIFKNTVGPGVGETYVYCKGFGLCALYDKLDSSTTNNPASWNENTDVCNLQTSTQNKNSYYEFNIQRESSQKVLNNFYDEYSVACLPREEYSIGFENVSRCGQPGTFCPSDWKQWNIQGKLSFTADDKGYGLFRDEAAVTSRIASNTVAPRVESIESYLSTPNQNPAKGPNAAAAAAQTPTTGAVTADESVKQAPIYALTSFETQCNFVLNKLKAVHNLCLPENRVDTYSTAGSVSPTATQQACGLNTSIPGTSVPYDQETMLTAFNNKGLTCQQLADSQQPEDKAFLSDLLKVSVAMDTAYRPAFIVAVTTFNAPSDPTNVTSKTEPQPTAGGKFQVVDYLEVKIPAVATDFLPPESDKQSSDLINPDRNAYQDPVLLTANALRSLEDQQAAVQLQLNDRDKLRQYQTSTIKPFGKIIGDNGNMPIFCNINGQLVQNCAQPAGTGTAYKDQIPEALVEFINASANVETHENWDLLPCDAHEVDIYGPNNKEQVAEQAKKILSQLKAQKVGPYDKKGSISTNITANVKDVTQGGNIQTFTELYFVTPQRYELQYAQSSFLAFLNDAQRETLTLNPVDKIVQDVADPSKFSPLLKSELSKSLSGKQIKGGAYRIIGPGTPGPNGVVSGPQIENFNLTGTLNDTSDFPDKQSIFWKVAGQVASLPTRMMALITTKAGTQTNDFTLGCTGDYATENWLLGKCQSALQTDPNKTASDSAGTVTDMCIETKIADNSLLQSYGAQLRDNLALPTTKDFWTRYYSGYRSGAPVYLFSDHASQCNPDGTCYDKIINDAIANHLNPYLAIAISLNETGGLKSFLPGGEGLHFGCGVLPQPLPDGTVISTQSIPVKLSCMLGAFNTYQSQGLNADAALKKYGYVNGVKNASLAKIIGIISNHTYAGVCQN